MRKILEAKNIRKIFSKPHKVEILKGINIDVHEGESVAITGRSGQGKSTLLNILGTLEPPCSGSVAIAGQKVNLFNRSRIRNRNLAFIFQTFHLFDDYTALENVLMPSSIGKIAVEKKHGLNLLEKVGLESRADFPAKLLSGGEKQRVAIARALCNDPDLILADEPSGNLDHETAQHIHALLLDFARKHGKSVVIVTHDPELANLCDTKLLLKDGTI